MKNPLTAVAYALMFLFSGVAVAEFLAQNDDPQEFTESATPDAIPADASAAQFSAFADPSPAVVQTASFTQSATANTDHAARVRAIVQRYLPDANDDVIDVLVEEYSEFDLDGVEFVMQQRQTSGLRVPDSLNISLDTIKGSGPGNQTEIAPKPAQTPVHGLNPLSRAIQTSAAFSHRNLLCASTPGFRRRVSLLDVNASMLDTPLPGTTAPGLPEVHVASPVTTSAFSVNVSVKTMWSWQPGKSIFTGDPLHVSLGDDPHLMFRLDDDAFTRRGDFQVLPDRRIGFRHSTGTFTLHDSPVIPQNFRSVQISETGVISVVQENGTRRELGQLTVVRLQELHRLESNDGVVFHAQTTEQPEVVTNPALMTQAIELSNVDRDEEWQELEHLRRMRQEIVMDLAAATGRNL